jgi:ABC-type bacteriocin/lantibiotic exporter with double-glycine peptidase domain
MGEGRRCHIEPFEKRDHLSPVSYVEDLDRELPPRAPPLETFKPSPVQVGHDDFVDSLPDKYNSVVGERGITLSGGQKQRVTIARAILTNPKILILDDSLSFVDAKTEQEIQEALEDAMKGRTTFIIAQRLSTIKNADKILVLEDGRVAEFGTHSELMAKAGIYKRVYETQFLDKTPAWDLEAP